MKRWLAITLVIPAGFGEAVSNFLIEEGATGVEEVGEDLRWEKLKVYFPKDGIGEKVLHRLRRYLQSLRKIIPEIARTQIETVSVPEQDWSENWKRFFKPFQVTPRLVVKPPWSKVRLEKNQIPINIHPGMAFGTGTHATTKLCMKALERSLRRKGLSVLDVGTGSGILSIAAAQLEASEVWGLDIDGTAVENARENVKRNSVSDIVKIRKGKTGDIQKRFDVVVSNIDLRNLKKMRWSLIHHLKYQGFLILSGILEEDGEELCQHYFETGHFHWAKVTHEEGWACIILKKR